MIKANVLQMCCRKRILFYKILGYLKNTLTILLNSKLKQMQGKEWQKIDQDSQDYAQCAESVI